MTDWIENTGTVPDGVGPKTVIEVQYRNCDEIATWDEPFIPPNNDPDLWLIDGGNLDVIRWRMVA